MTLSTPLSHMSTGAIVQVFLVEMEARVGESYSRSQRSMLSTELRRSRERLAELQARLARMVEDEYAE